MEDLMIPTNFDQSISQLAANSVPERVVVAVKAEKSISKTALAWALTHVVHPGDCVTLLAVLASEKTGKSLWRFPKLTRDCGSSHRNNWLDRISQISESCSQMVLQFHNQVEVRVRIKVVSGTPGTAVAAEASNSSANWVILDKKLKQELKHCIEELRCNIVVMKGSEAKVLRLNLQVSDEIHTPFFSASSSPTRGTGEFQEHRMKHSTPVSSPEEPGISHSRIRREGLLGSSDEVTSVFRVYGQNPLFEGVNRTNYREIEIHNDLDEHLGAHDTHGEKLITSRKPISPIPSDNESVFWIPQNHVADEKPLRNSRKNTTYPTSKTLLDSFVEHDIDIKTGRNELKQSHQKDYMAQSNIMSTVSLGRTSSIPPPLCSFCQHKTPVFGKPPRQFAYGELEEATNGFSDTNILAEGGFGVVYRGLLRHGQVIAVKLLKFGGSQADTDFCREVRVLSCAQHRNVVLLIGFCVDRKMRFLVYEYVCNGSLDFHLHGNQTPLDWHSRQKIAIGTARGLRYLHEDCRVGCIVHRDMRPHNVLLTHDFEPLVADFGLARWYSECSMSTEERVIGTSGYLAPEYVDGGIISEKVDVYAFGLVLLELITGRRPSELQLYEGRHFLANYWSQPRDSLERNNTFADIYQLLDPFLASDQLHNFTHQLHAMVRAASLCLSRDPESRPPMSKVLRILEGGNMSISMAIDLDTVGNRSGHLRGLSTLKQPEIRRSHSRRLSH